MNVAPSSPLATDVVSCPHAAQCGACALLGMSYRAELEHKREVVVQALRLERDLARVPVAPCLPSPRISGYRSRAKMAVTFTGRGHVALGYYRLGTRTLVDAPECRVLEPALLQTTRGLRDLLRRPHGEPAALRFIDVRCGSDPQDQHLTLVLGATRLPRLPLREMAQACPALRGISVNFNPGSSPQVLHGPIKNVWGEPTVRVRVADLAIAVSPGSFFQVNLSLLPLIHERLHGFLHGCRTLLDLYAGVGTHGLALAHAAEQVLLVEGVPASARDARTAVDRHGLTHVHVMNAPVERAVARIGNARADAVVLNPSRQGATPPVLGAIAASGARRVAYLSCDPTTLTRDLAALARIGFDVLSVEPIDMMPQTAQVEALALLERRARPSARGSLDLARGKREVAPGGARRVRREDRPRERRPRREREAAPVDGPGRAGDRRARRPPDAARAASVASPERSAGGKPGTSRAGGQ